MIGRTIFNRDSDPIVFEFYQGKTKDICIDGKYTIITSKIDDY